jgi:hypothetical protein
MRCRSLLVVLLLLALASRAPAGIIFGRKAPKPTPDERVPELIGIIKTDGDENKRLDAIAELRQYDARAFPNIVPVLIEVLLTDKKPIVRAEAAQSLGRLRPVYQEAGQALEQALHNDTSPRVRLQARSALLQYHWLGYHSGQAPPPANAGKDPPAPPAGNTSAKNPTQLPGPAANLPPIRPQPVQPSRYPPPAPRPTTAEPPLAPVVPPAVTPGPKPIQGSPLLQPPPALRGFPTPSAPARMPVGPPPAPLPAPQSAPPADRGGPSLDPPH